MATITAEQIMSMRIVENTQSQYAGYQKRILKYWADHHPEQIDHAGHIHAEVMSAPGFGKLFVDYLATLRHHLDPTILAGISTLNSFRSAMKSYFEDRDVIAAADYEPTLKKFFSGAKRADATDRLKGKRLANAKKPLKFSLFQHLALLTLGLQDAAFAHCYLLLTWNLMSRASTTQNINLCCITDLDDALGIYVPKSKGDQDGRRGKDPRHIYANPLQPHLCPFLALGLYLSTNHSAHPDGPSALLFEGSKQKERFYKTLKALIKKNEDELGKEYAVHSIRKGAGIA
jgi:hypothetical protein